MVMLCGIINCGKKSGLSGKSFFRLPSDLSKQKASEEKRALSSLRREKWLSAIKRDDLTETKKRFLRICEDHFISRKPAELWDKDNPDWVPSLNLGYDKKDTSASDLDHIRKKFVCHQGAFRKLTPETNKRKSKNSGCLALIRIRVKRTTKSTIKADPFVKKGLPAVITIKDQHNHNLNAAETLRCLNADVCREKFIEYFNNGMKVSTALKHHRELLKLRHDISEEDMTNNRINPTSRTVSHWFCEWRMGKYKPKETKVNDHLKVEIVEQQLGNEKSIESEHGKDFESCKGDINQQGLNIQYTIQVSNQYLNKIRIPSLPSKRKHRIADHHKQKLLKIPEPVKILPANSLEKKIEIESVFSLDQFLNKQNTVYLPQPATNPIPQANSSSPVIKFNDETDKVFHKVDKVIDKQDTPRLTIVFLPPPTVVLSPVIKIREDGFCKVDQAVSRNDILNTLYVPKPTVDQNLQENSPSPVTIIKEEIEIEDVCKVNQ